MFLRLSKAFAQRRFRYRYRHGKSRGSHIHDAASGDNWLDFYTFFASSPFGMNHPKLETPEFKEKIFRAAINKVANSDIYTQEMAEFIKMFGEVAVPEGYNTHSLSTTAHWLSRIPSRSQWTGRSASFLPPAR